MFLLINFAVFQLAWLSSVLGGAKQMPWLGPVAVLIALTIHFKAARRPFEELLLVISCALIGAAFDSMLVAMGWVTYSAGLFSSVMAPYWIITMWMLFATTLNVSMRWMRGKTGLAAFFGFFGGPMAYITGQHLGGIQLANPIASLAALAIGWAIMMPILMKLSEMFDGMPMTPTLRKSWLPERQEW